jgi:hypothetical protein
MDFQALNIKIDPGTALTTLEQTTTKLRATEIQGQEAAKAMSGVSGAFKLLGQAIQQEQSALARLNTLHEQLAVKNSGLVGSFNGIAAAIQREQTILERINGPSRRYMEDLQALDALLSKNTISTEQYVEQVTKLNGAIEQTRAAGSGPAASGGGGADRSVFRDRGILDPSTVAIVGSRLGGIGGGALGNVVSGLATGGVIGAAIAGVDALVGAFDHLGEAAKRDAAQMVQFKDQLTLLRNETQKFVDAGHTSNQVIAEQAQLAHDLHSKLDDTVSVYDAVRESASDLNLTHAEQIRLTRSLAESLLSNNKPLSDAGSLMGTLADATKSGHLSTEQFATIAKQVPGVVKEWEQHFNLSGKALADAVSSGKVAVGSLIDVTTHGGQSIDATHAKLTRTVGQYRDELAETYKRELAISGDTSLAGKYDAIQKALTAAGTEGVDNAERIKDAYEVLGDSFTGVGAGQLKFMLSTQLTSGALDKQDQSTVELSQHFARLGDDILKFAAREASVDSLTKTVTGTLDKFDNSLANIGRHLSNGEVAAGLEHALAGIVEQTKNYGEAAFKLVGGDDPWDPTRLQDRLNAAKNFHHELTSEEQLLNSIRAPMTQANALIRDSADLYAKGAISAAEWGEQVRKAQALAGVEPSVRSVVSGEGGDAFTPFKGQPGIGFPGAPNMNEVSSAQLDAARAAAENGVTGYDANWKRLSKASTDSANTVKDAWKEAMNDVNSSIVDAVTKGSLDFRNLGSQLEQLLAKLALTGLETGITGLFTGGGSTQVAAAAHLQGYADGGSGVIPGYGPPDSKLFVARVTPGEHFQFTPPERVAAMQAQASRAAGSNPAAAPTTVNSPTIINMMYDRRAIIDNRDDARRFAAAARRNPSAFGRRR